MLDLNHRSGLVYGRAAFTPGDAAVKINAHIDMALVARNQRQKG